MALLLGTQKSIETRIKPLVPKKLEGAAEVVAAAVTTVSASALAMSALHKIEAYTSGAVKFFSTSGFEVIKSLKTGGMLGVASIVDSLFGLIIRSTASYIFKDGSKLRKLKPWLEAAGIRETPYIPQWDSHQKIPLNIKPVKQKVKIEIPNWLRITQRAAALAITYFAFSAIIGPQPLLLACAVTDLTWFVFNGLKAGMNSPAEPQGAIYMLGQALMCATPEVYMICAGIAITSYIVYLAAKKQFMNDQYYLVKNGVKTDKKTSFTLANAKHFPIGIRKIDKKASLRFDGETLSGKKNETLDKLKKQLEEYEGYVGKINDLTPDQYKFQSYNLTVSDNPFLSISTIARFLNKTLEDWTDQKTLTKKLQEEKAKLEQLFNVREAKHEEYRKQILDQNSTIAEIKSAGAKLTTSIKEGAATRTKLGCINKLLDALEKKSYDDVHKEIEHQAKKHADILRAYINLMRFINGNLEISTPQQKKDFNLLFCAVSIAICKLRINQKTAPAPDNKTIYWEALYKGEKVILRQDQLYAIPVSQRSNEGSRQKKTCKLSVLKDIFGTATNTFLQQAAGMDLTALIGGGGLISQIGTAAFFGGMELLKLIPEDSSLLDPLGPFKSRLKPSDDDEDPTGNAQDGLKSKEHALFSSQVNRCAQIIDDYQHWYDSQDIKLPGIPKQNAGPLFKDGKKKELTTFRDTSSKEHPSIGIVNRALINELDIEGATEEEKYEKLQLIIEKAQGENLEERAERLKNKQEALSKATTTEKKEEIEKQFADPIKKHQLDKEEALSKAKTDKQRQAIERRFKRTAPWKATLNSMEYKMDLLTPLDQKRLYRLKRPTGNPKVGKENEELQELRHTNSYKIEPLTRKQIQELAAGNLTPLPVPQTTSSAYLDLAYAMAKKTPNR